MTCSDYRKKARESLAGKWGMAVIVSLFAALFGALLTSAEVNINIKAEVQENLPEILRTYLKIAAGTGTALSLLHIILGGVIQLGYCRYLLKLHDGEEGELKDLFSQFDRFGDGFCLNLLRSLYIFLWTLLFIIPGIVATFKYAMAPFLMVENPGMKAGEAITASKELMDGHKGDLFLLGLSFFGWCLLNVLTLGIGSLWLNPYMNMSYAAFYRDIHRPAPELDPPAAPEFL